MIYHFNETVMATRPIYIPATNGSALVITKMIDFEWHAGLAPSQKQKSINSLHLAAKEELGIDTLLEISSKSKVSLGVNLSAFNLMILLPSLENKISVESAYQASKVFEGGIQYRDILNKNSRDAKTDARIKESGRLVGFNLSGQEWGLEPKTAFYDWLYISALCQNENLNNSLLEYSAFTDIEFNPKKSINCQAYAVALFVSLKTRGVIEEALASKDSFLRIIRDRDISNAHQDDTLQGQLKF